MNFNDKKYSVFFILLILFYSNGYNASFERRKNFSPSAKQQTFNWPHLTFQIKNISLIYNDNKITGLNITRTLTNPSNTSVVIYSGNLCCYYYLYVNIFPHNGSRPYSIGGPDFYSSSWPTAGSYTVTPGNSTIYETIFYQYSYNKQFDYLPDGKYYIEFAPNGWGNFSFSSYPVQLIIANNQILDFMNYTSIPYDYSKLRMSIDNIDIIKQSCNNNCGSIFFLNFTMLSIDDSYYPHTYAERIFNLYIQLIDLDSNITYSDLTYSSFDQAKVFNSFYKQIIFRIENETIIFSGDDEIHNILSFNEGNFRFQFVNPDNLEIISNNFDFEMKNGLLVPGSVKTSNIPSIHTSSIITGNNISLGAFNVFTWSVAMVSTLLLFRKKH